MKFMYCSIRCLLEKQSQNTRKHARLIKVKSRELWPSSYYKSGFNISFLFNISIDMNQHHIRASPRALVSWVSQLKKKTKNSYPTETLSTSSSILVFYPEGVAGHLCLVLSANHSFLDFGGAFGFRPFFASYFVLHNSYIRILAIHRYKSSWRCSQSTTQHRSGCTLAPISLLKFLNLS